MRSNNNRPLGRQDTHSRRRWANSGSGSRTVAAATPAATPERLLWLQTQNQDALTAAIEAGYDTVLFADGGAEARGVSTIPPCASCCCCCCCFSPRSCRIGSARGCVLF